MFRALAVLLILAIAPIGVSADPPISLLRTGSFHGKEVSVRSGEQWLGLVPKGDGFFWSPLTLSVRRERDVVADAPGKQTGIRITTPGATPILLIKGAPQLADVTVAAGRFFNRRLAFTPQTPARTIRVGAEKRYTLEMVAGASGKGHRLILEGDGLRQTLYTWAEGFEDQHCELIRSGDLDGDGNLDLFMNISDHYNVQEERLFLSTKKRAGRLVEQVAVLRTVGC